MPTNRPFFANFFAAFRAHSALQKSSPAINASSNTTTTSSTAAAAAAAYSTLSRTYHTSSSPIPSEHHSNTTTSSSQIPIKQPQPAYTTSHHSTTPHSATTVSAAPPQSHFRSSRPLHPPSGTPHSRGRMRSTSREAPVYGPQTHEQTLASPPFRSRTPSPGGMPTPSYTAPPRGRRGSDSSSHSSGSGLGASIYGASPPPVQQQPLAEKWYIGGRTAQGEERFYKLGLVQSSRSADRLSLDRLSL